MRPTYFSLLTSALLSSIFISFSHASPTRCVPIAQLAPPPPNTMFPNKPFFIDTRGLSPSALMPKRDPLSPIYPPATQLSDEKLPPTNKIGNFILGPTHTLPSIWPESATGPQGTLISFTLSSQTKDHFSPGIARFDDIPCPNGLASQPYSLPNDPSNLIVPNTDITSWERSIDIYIPPGMSSEHPAPFLIFGDGGENGIYPGHDLFILADALIREKKIPPIIIIGIGSGGGDAQGSERGKEYDTMSGEYADWIEEKVLPAIEKRTGYSLSHNPEERATMGFSSSGAAAFAMAWFRPNLYHRVLAYSPTLTNQQWPHNPSLPGGGWQLHSPWAGDIQEHPSSQHAALIPSAPTKPLHIWYEIGDQDLFYPVRALPDGMHDWVLAAENMARTLHDKHYDYQFVFSRNAQHVDGATIEQTLPEALEWLWNKHNTQ